MIFRSIQNIYRLGIKELWSLWRDRVMLVLILFVFTFSIYSAATSMPETINNAAIAIVDEDHSPLSKQIIDAFYPPQFTYPDIIDQHQVDIGMDSGKYTFALIIPLNFQRDVLAGNKAEMQLNTDATRMSQAFVGSNYIQQIALAEVNEFINKYRSTPTSSVELAIRARFNPSLDKSWFGALTEIINAIAMLSIILTGAALIREREHGTIEHLLVMPVTTAEIMISKIWSMGLVVLCASALSIHLVVKGALGIPISGSLWLFFLGASLMLFATTSLGIFMATLAKNMPQFGMLVVLVLLPLEMLSGGSTPYESMPVFVQFIMHAAPTTHFVKLGGAILFRDAGIDIVWPQFLSLFIIGTALFCFSLARFRKTISQMA